MKRKQNIIIMLAVILILGAVSFMLYSKNKAKSEEDTSLYMTETKLSDVKTFSITYEGKTSVYENTEDGWVYPADSAFPVNSKLIDDLTRKFKMLYANRIVEGENISLSDFGLDNPQCIVSATDEDGQSVTYNIGDFNSSLGRYYYKTQDSDTIYLVGSGQTETFFKTLTDTVGEYDLSQVNSNNATKITVTTGDTNFVAKRIADGDGIQLYSDEFKWALTEPYSTPLPVDSNKIFSLGSKFSKLNLQLITYTPDENQLTEYGLSNPTAEISFDYSYSQSLQDYDKNATLLFGKTTENGDTYVKFKDFPLVYTIPKDDYDMMSVFFVAENFMPSKICEIDLETVNSMEITTQNNTYSIEITRANGVASYSVNGTAVDTSEFEKFYKNLISITKEKPSNESFDDINKLNVVFNRNTEAFSTMELSYLEYDNTYSRANFNGIDYLLVNRKSVDSVITALEDLVK